MAITLLASQVPVPASAPAPADIAGCTSSTTTAPISGEVTAFGSGVLSAESLNELLAVDSVNALGGGNGFGILQGLGISAGTGLTANVAAGTALLAWPVQRQAGSYVLPDDQALVFLWLKGDGTLTHTLTTTPPSGNALHIGTFTTVAGAITLVDASGVVFVRDGIRWRQTYDLGQPTDTPGAGTAFLTRTRTGLWLWDGSAYVQIGPSGRSDIAMSDVGDTTATDSQAARRTLRLTGTLTAPRNLVLPAFDGSEWAVVNTTAETVTVKTAAGAGVAIATLKTAIVRGDGTDIVRVTADA